MNFARALCRYTTAVHRTECFGNSLLQSSIVPAASYSVKVQHRQPIKVYKPDGRSEYDDSDQNNKETQKVANRRDRIKGVIELQKNASPNKIVDKLSDDSEKAEESDSEDEELLGTKYTRLGDSNKLFDRMIIQTQSKRQREKSSMFVLEGKRLIQEAVTADILPKCIFFSRRESIESLELPPGVIDLYKIPYSTMKKWSPLQTPPGIVAFCKIPKIISPRNVKQNKNAVQLPLTLICDNVREPGNLGSILRTMAAVGCSDILLTKGCTDIWDLKVLRAAAGAHFHMPITSGLTWDDIGSRVSPSASVFIADHQQRSAEDQSLNTVPYFSVNYSCLSDMVLVLGGETEGVSADAVQFTRYRDGVHINIPLENNVDSLNVVAAISTLLFEIKRQYIVNRNTAE